MLGLLHYLGVQKSAFSLGIPLISIDFWNIQRAIFLVVPWWLIAHFVRTEQVLYVFNFMSAALFLMLFKVPLNESDTQCKLYPTLRMVMTFAAYFMLGWVETCMLLSFRKYVRDLKKYGRNDGIYVETCFDVMFILEMEWRSSLHYIPCDIGVRWRILEKCTPVGVWSFKYTYLSAWFLDHIYLRGSKYFI